MSIPEDETAGDASGPNVVLIVADDLQFSDIRAYGGGILTPEIDRLAREGVKFTRAYSTASMCTPSRFSVLTGLYPGRCQSDAFLYTNPPHQPYNIAWNTWLTSDVNTLPRALGKLGYTTGMAGKWHLSPRTSVLDALAPEPDSAPDRAEIDRQLGRLQSAHQDQVKIISGFDYASSIVWSNVDSHPVEALRFHNIPWITKGAVEFIHQQRGSRKPFFLYVAPTAIHGPNHTDDLGRDKSYTPGGRDRDVLKYTFDEQRLRERTDSFSSQKAYRSIGIANIDFQLGLVREALRAIGEEDSTIIIFTADHNIEPGKATSYEKGIRIPMIIAWPSQIRGGRIDSSLVSSLDLFPTLLALSDNYQEGNTKLDGRSFAHVLRDLPGRNRGYVFSENGFTRSVSDERYKYIAFRYPKSFVTYMKSKPMDYVPSYVGKWPQSHSAIAMQSYPAYFDQNQLYDLKHDPYEQYNIYWKQPKEAARLKGVLAEHVESFTHPFSLDDSEYMATRAFRQKSRHNLDFDLRSIPWFRRDHSDFVWPPEEDQIGEKEFNKQR